MSGRMPSASRAMPQVGTSKPGLTLEDYMGLGYRHQLRGGVDPAPDAAATIDQAEVIDEIARLDPFIKRDAISKGRQAFLRRVLDMQGDQSQAVSKAVVDAKPVSA